MLEKSANDITRAAADDVAISKLGLVRKICTQACLKFHDEVQIYLLRSRLELWIMMTIFLTMLNSRPSA